MRFLKSFRNRIASRPETLLTIASVVSLVVTVIVTSKGTTKAVLTMNEAENIKRDDLTSSEKFRCTWKCYVPAIVMSGVTSACIIGSDCLGRRREANLTAAYIFLEQSIKNYKAKITELEDDLAKQELLKEKANELAPTPHEDTEMVKFRDNDALLFYIDHYDSFFERTMLEVMYAEYQLDKKLIVDGCCKLNDFFDYLGLERTQVGNLLGWGYGTSWIDFEHTMATTDDGLECYMITMKEPPSVNYLPF